MGDDLGCGHGGLVALARQAGYEATGLELDASAADFARRAFQVPVLQGSLETQDLPAGSQDIIVLNDVLGCLADPVATLDAATRYICSLEIIKVQLQIWMVKEEELESQLGGSQCFAA